jgi:predicted AlkP superfamily pyrophosphatase or phosphodiesterase
MRPSFPSKTFPNHHSIATGLYPSEHGIILNTFEDPLDGSVFAIRNVTAVRESRWWGGEPIWATAERQGLRSWLMMWPGCSTRIAGVVPQAFMEYNASVGVPERASLIERWMTAARDKPSPLSNKGELFMAYFEGVDQAGHAYGPGSPQVREAIARADDFVGRVYRSARRLAPAGQLTFVVVSDHGMSALDRGRQVFLDRYLDMSRVKVWSWSPMAMLSLAGGSHAEIVANLTGVEGLEWVALKEDVDPRFHISLPSQRLIAPVVALAKDGWFVTTAARGWANEAGDHGYDNQLRSMEATFMATGTGEICSTRVRTNKPMPNTELYRMFSKALKVKPAGSNATWQQDWWR